MTRWVRVIIGSAGKKRLDEGLVGELGEEAQEGAPAEAAKGRDKCAAVVPFELGFCTHPDSVPEHRAGHRLDLVRRDEPPPR